MKHSIDHAFWMVYGVGQGAPTVRHRTFSDAESEAKRLARACPGVEFLVLLAVGRARKVDVEFTQLCDPDSEIPF